MANLKRYRMEIVDGRVQERHDAGTGEWYAASEVDQDRANDELRIAVAMKILSRHQFDNTTNSIRALEILTAHFAAIDSQLNVPGNK